MPLTRMKRSVGPFVRRCEEVRTASAVLLSVFPKVIQFLQPLQNLIGHGAYFRCGEYAIQAPQAVRPICVWEAPAFLWLALLDLAPAIHFKKPAGGRQFQPIPAPDQAVLQEFLPRHAEIGRNAVDFFFRKVCAVCPTAIPTLAAIISGKQFLMERQELPIQLVRICMNLEEGSETQIFILPLLSGSVDIFWRNHSREPHSRQISWIHYILFPSHAQEGYGGL